MDDMRIQRSDIPKYQSESCLVTYNFIFENKVSHLNFFSKFIQKPTSKHIVSCMKIHSVAIHYSLINK